MVTFNARQKTKYFEHFKAFCNKRLYVYHARRSRSSNYVEVTVGAKVYLFRFSDHPALESHMWTPDFDIRDSATFNAAKKFMTALDRNIALMSQTLN